MNVLSYDAVRSLEMTRTPRVCMLTETFPPVLGGAESNALLMAKSMNSLGMSTFVVTRRCEAQSSSHEMVDGVDTYRIPPVGEGRWGKVGMMPHALRELVRLRNQYDLIYVCSFRMLGVPAIIAARLLGKSCILRSETNGEMSGAYASAYRKLPLIERAIFCNWLGLRDRTIKRADGFLGITNLIADEFKSCGVETGRIARIPNGIDTEVFRPALAGTRYALRQRLHLPAQGRLIVYTGRLISGKGVEYLLQAWERIVHSRSNTYLVLVGSGSGEANCNEAALRRFVRERKLESSVIFTGWAKNVRDYLQASDMFVFPTEYEGFGLSLVEAMACGLPVIASRVGGIPEIVTEGVDGILVEPRNPSELERAIVSLLDNPESARALATHARQTVRDRFSIDSVARQHVDLFTRIWREREISSGANNGA